MCAEALADIVVFNQTFLQAKKCKKKKNLDYAVCVSRLSADYCSFLSNFFACKKYKNKKNLNYAVCVSRLSIDTVVIYQTFSRAKNAKKEEPRLRGLRVEALDCLLGLKKMPCSFLLLDLNLHTVFSWNSDKRKSRSVVAAAENSVVHPATIIYLPLQFFTQVHQRGSVLISCATSVQSGTHHHGHTSGNSAVTLVALPKLLILS